MFDVAIIGAGVVGALTARELTRYNLSACLLEKENDVACGASKGTAELFTAALTRNRERLKQSLMQRACRFYIRRHGS